MLTEKKNKTTKTTLQPQSWELTFLFGSLSEALSPEGSQEALRDRSKGVWDEPGGVFTTKTGLEVEPSLLIKEKPDISS